MKVLQVFGTCPEAIKMAPVVHVLNRAEGIENIVCVFSLQTHMALTVRRPVLPMLPFQMAAFCMAGANAYLKASR